MTRGFVACAAALALGGCGIEEARTGLAKQDALLAKVAIEDLLKRHNQGLGGGEPAALDEFYAEDAVLEVNGIVAEGRDEIEAFYAGTESGESAARQATTHRVLNNVVVDVEGDTATASMVWTGVLNSDLRGPPRLVEQGREYDLLVFRGNDWLIKKRVVVADSGLPESMAANYDARMNYDISAE